MSHRAELPDQRMVGVHTGDKVVDSREISRVDDYVEVVGPPLAWAIVPADGRRQTFDESNPHPEGTGCLEQLSESGFEHSRSRPSLEVEVLKTSTYILGDVDLALQRPGPKESRHTMLDRAIDGRV